MRCLLPFICLLTTACVALPGDSKTFQIGTSESSQFVSAAVVASPRPRIPSQWHEKCFKSCCIARFVINPDGRANVELISSSGSLEIDEATLATLRRWKFRPAMLNGQPVASTRRVRIEFEVE